MNSTIYEILTSFIKRVIKREKFYTAIGVVISVDKTNDTIQYKEKGTTFNQTAELTINGSKTKGIIIYPKVGCNVLVNYTNSSDGYMIQCDDIDEIYVNSTSVIFNSGTLGGLVKIDSLVSNIQERETRINNIVVSLTSLSAACTNVGAIPLLGTILGGLITSAIAPIIAPIVPTVKTTLENTSIKQ